MARWPLQHAVWSALLLSVLVSPLAAQQTPVVQQAGRPSTVVLPPRLLPGEHATLAVLDSAGRLVPNAAVEFPGDERVTTDASGRASFVAPLTPGVLTARLPGRPGTASATILAPQPLPADGLQITEYPHIISLTDRFLVDGYGFSGQADGNRVMLGEKPVAVLAASPVALVLMPVPAAGAGPAQLVIEVGGRSPGPVPVTLVLLRVRGPDYQLSQSQKGTLTVRIHGTEQRLAIEARNLSPTLVDLPRGNIQRVTSSGGAQNEAQIELVGLAAGNFSVSVRLVPGAVGLPDMEAARQLLLSARRTAPADWQERLDRLIRRIDRDPQDVARIRDDLERMLAQSPDPDLAKQIEAAWKIVLKR
jgi:hypothetical protein